MAKPTQAEIDAEITALETMKPDVRKTTAFGDDNHDAIDAQIRVLKGEIDIDNIDEVFDPEDNHHLYSSARDAMDWLDGDADNAPSVDWEPLTN